MKVAKSPSPIASPMMVQMIATYNEDGSVNLMNAAWGGQIDNDLIVLSLDRTHKTAANILARKAFTVGFPSAKDIVDCDYVGIVSGNKVPDKFAKTKLHAKASKAVDAPYIEEFPLTYECTLERVIDDEYGFCVLGRVKDVLVEEAFDLGKGRYDVDAMGLVLFTALDNTYRTVGGVAGKAFSCGLERKGK